MIETKLLYLIIPRIPRSIVHEKRQVCTVLRFDFSSATAPVTSWRNWQRPASMGRVGSLRWVT